MQDRVSHHIKYQYFISQTPEAQVYAVFDGHGSSAVSSEYVSQNLHKNILNQVQTNLS